MKRIIGGGPRTGKTTLANGLGGNVRHADDTIGMGWSESSEEVSRWLDEPGDQTIEGVQAARALRKWLVRNPEGKPCDEVVWLSNPKVGRSSGQETMAKGCEKVFSEIEPELKRRGVTVRKG
jgi:dephospho-CoA kinase